MGFDCDECRAIYLEFRQVADAMRRTKNLITSSADLVEWLNRLNEEEFAQIRETSPLWKTWRRFQEHKTLTGHSVSVLLPPDAAPNPN